MMDLRGQRERGVTLVELMIAVAVTGIIALAFSQAQRYIVRFTLVSKAKQEVLTESRTALAVMQKMIQQGSAQTFVIDQSTGQPPYSQIYFKATTAAGVSREFKFYQMGKVAYMDYRDVGGAVWRQKILTKSVRFLSFFYPKTNDNKLLSISLTISRKTNEGKESFLQLVLQKVRIINS